VKRSKFTEEQIICAINQAEAGVPIAEVARSFGVEPPTGQRSEPEMR